MFELVVIAICLFLNAVLSCVEMAFVTVSKAHLKKLAADGDSVAQKVLNLKSNPERVLSVLQIGITLVGAISAAVGGAGAEESLSPIFMNQFGLEEKIAESLAIFIVVIPITFLSVVIGELVPKTLALQFPMRFAKLGSTFLLGLQKAFGPAVSLLEVSTKIITKIFLSRLKPESLSELSTSVEIDSLSDTHKQYVFNLLSVDKRKVKDIMLPWDSVIKVSHSAHARIVLGLIKSSGHTRIPVIEDELPIGILHSKDFISEEEISKIDWLQLVRPVIFVGVDETILGTLKILQHSSSHMAVVKKGDLLLGIVTLEDIFEEVVGEIYDEDEAPRVLLSSNSKIRTMNLPQS